MTLGLTDGISSADASLSGSLSSRFGVTPLIELTSLSKRLPHRIYGKCEFRNHTGSVKDRIGAYLVSQAELHGIIRPGRSTLIEATAGNTGVSLAVACRGRYRLICTMSDKMGPEKEALLRAWGAEVIRCPYEVAVDDPRSFINRARALADDSDDGYFVDQFSNPWNTEAHYLTTGSELVEQIAMSLGGDIAAFVAGVGTGGTFSGVTRRLADANIVCQLVLADPVGSVLAAAVNGENVEARPYKIEGIGGDFVPPQFDVASVTRAISVPDAESIATCREVAKLEGLLLGGSSGCALSAAIRLAEELPGPRSNILVMLPDGGERYLTTVYSPTWRPGP